jgi:hypothetical protein
VKKRIKPGIPVTAWRAIIISNSPKIAAMSAIKYRLRNGIKPLITKAL